MLALLLQFGAAFVPVFEQVQLQEHRFAVYTMIAWIRYDETEVPMFSFPWYKGLSPEKNDYAQYPGSYDYKYPIAGAKNSVVSDRFFSRYHILFC